MSDLALRVDNLGKLYRIGQRRNTRTLREMLAWSAHRQVQTIRAVAAGTYSRQAVPGSIWALRNVSFEVKHGEIVGFIGRNGAGKSTLLKILSRITLPTEGRVEGYGRVRSLLEVGTGFHPELTGRENIFLNGAVLGMSRAETSKKFDEIVAFSEIDKFLDTPVKYYSSGMYVRLAFSVAAHLEPEILIVDEVLAVGDAAFQKKCLGRMGDAATKEGRTVLFVSHNMAAVQSLCAWTCWLDGGRLVDLGNTQQVVQNYLQSVNPDRNIPLDERQDRTGDGSARIVSVCVESVDTGLVIYPDSRLKITVGYRSSAPVLYPSFWIAIHDHTTNSGLFRLSSDGVDGFPERLPPEGRVTCTTEPINLTPGRCYVNLTLKKGPAEADVVQYAAFFEVEDKNVEGTGKTAQRTWVLTVVEHRWSVDGETP